MMAAVDQREPARAGPGDRDAILSAVHRTEYGRLVGLARLLLDDRGQAEEVVQEAFVRTYANWDRVRTKSDPLPYLRTSVVNLARGGLRRRRTARAHRPERALHAVAAEQVVDERTTSTALADAVRALPERQRECVVLRYYLECSTAECAAALGISEGSVKTHLHRALVALGPPMEALR
jgi:RNA polymerase sigma-70 factor (sigma-E family)